MPKYYEYVFSAYGIWIAVFVIYFAWLFLKSRRVSRALEQLSREAQGPADGP